MAKMTAATDFSQLLERVSSDFPDVNFVAGKTFCWSPANRQVVYQPQAKGRTACYSLLHELAHARLGHQRYKLDFELVELEVAAWEEAKVLAGRYQLSIDEDHLQNCLDTYRHWLYRRCICPACGTKALQQDDAPLYRCYNCHSSWRVTPSRFCRPYRQSQAGAGNNPVFAAEI